jgi:hypothetical protein
MPRYEDHDVTFESPDDWEDRSIVAHIGYPDDKGATPNVMITREPMKEGETLSEYRDRQIVDLAQQLKDFEIYESRDARVDGNPAISLRYTLDSPEGTIEQTLTMVERALPDGKRMVFSFATSTPATSVSTARKLLEDVLKTVRFGSPPPGGAPPPPSMPPMVPSSSGGAGQGGDMPYVPMPGQRRR